jgi:hypothetical protein
VAGTLSQLTGPDMEASVEQGWQPIATMTLGQPRRADSAPAVWRQELARLDQLRVVAQAQEIVAAAEYTDLTHAPAGG